MFFDPSCNTDPNESASRYWEHDPVPVTSGSCTPVPSSTITQPGFEDRIALCRAPAFAGAGCDPGDFCGPRPPEGAAAELCIAREGEHDCPENFPVFYQYNRDFDDERACAECTCGDPEGTCTNYSVQLFNSDCSGGLSAGTIPVGACTQSAALTTGAARLTNASAATGIGTSDDAACPPQQAVPAEIGTLEAIDPVTVCCASTEER